MNALQRHLSKAAKRKAEMLHSGELPASAAGGRKPKPTPCSRCGVEAIDVSAAAAAMSAARKTKTGGRNGGRPVSCTCGSCRICRQRAKRKQNKAASQPQERV